MKRDIIKQLCGMALMLASSLTISAITLEEAKEAFNKGEYAVAVDELARVAQREPNNTLLNQMAGIAIFKTGHPEEAVKYLKLGQNESNLYLAEIALDRYRIEEADHYLEVYEKGLGKGRKKKEPSPMVERLESKKNMISGMLDRVAAIEIIDSMMVGREDFFKKIRLSPSAGSLNPVSILPRNVESVNSSVVFQTENGNYRIWSAPDAGENYELVSSTKLSDGTWEEPHSLGAILNDGGDANYPFLMSDGVTLYFANNGDNSMGGYDIFIASDNGDGYLQPQNMGMPFNSTADDYMLAIDEEAGIGWWATDRNHLDGFITIYKFIPQEYRVNYPIDTPNLSNLAIVNSIKDSWKGDGNYEGMMKLTEEANNGPHIIGYDFEFAMPGGKVYHYMSDFKSSQAKSRMERYLDARDELLVLEDRLYTLREKWRAGDHRSESQILTLEDKITQQKARITSLSNEVVKAEMGL